MDQNLEIAIILAIEKNIEQFDSYSIKKAAHDVFYDSITLNEQKKLAKLIVRKHHFITEIKGGEIIVKKNTLYTGIKGDTNKDFNLLKSVMFIIVAVLSYLIFDVFLRSLTK